MSADREAAIRAVWDGDEKYASPWERLVYWQHACERAHAELAAAEAELAAAREREEKLREALRQYVAAIDRGEQGHVAALRAALSEGEG